MGSVWATQTLNRTVTPVFSHILLRCWRVLSFPHRLKLISEAVSGTAGSALLFSLLPPLPWSHTLGIWHTSRVTHRAVRSCYFPAENFPELLHLPQKPTRHYISRPITSFSFGHTVELVGSSFPDQGLNPCPLHWKRGVLTSGMPGKSASPLKSHLLSATPLPLCFSHSVTLPWPLHSLLSLPELSSPNTSKLHFSTSCKSLFFLPLCETAVPPSCWHSLSLPCSIFNTVLFRVFYDCVAYCLSAPY